MTPILFAKRASNGIPFREPFRVHLQSVRGLEVGTTAPAIFDGAVIAIGTGAGVACAGGLTAAMEHVS